MSRATKISKKVQTYGTDVSQDRTLVKATVHGDAALTTGVAGGINGFIALDPGAISDTDWADFSSTYDEFRVLGVRMRFTCVAPNSTLANAFLAVAFDNDNAANPGSFSAVRQYSTHRLMPLVWSTDKVITMTWWRPTRGEETTIPWCDIGNSASSLGSIKLFTTGVAASTTYLNYAIDLFVEFRGRR